MHWASGRGFVLGAWLVRWGCGLRQRAWLHRGRGLGQWAWLCERGHGLGWAWLGVGVSHLSKLPLPQLLPEAEEATWECWEGGAGGGARAVGGASEGIGGASGDVSFSIGPRPHLGFHYTYGVRKEGEGSEGGVVYGQKFGGVRSGRGLTVGVDWLGSVGRVTGEPSYWLSVGGQQQAIGWVGEGGCWGGGAWVRGGVKG